jgi:hypothetical protein
VCPATSYSHRGKPPITIGAEELNYRVRDGNGCDLFAIATGLIGCKSFDVLHMDVQVLSRTSFIIFSRFRTLKTENEGDVTLVCG